ncbi:MAG: YqgE/AlgH family protein [SAR324 cluster bacterium]|nr:YqgE/AlgH family protein [SAR324 cluster bacterium]
MNEEEIVPGLLVAMPVLKDSYFEKTVILLCNYTEESAFGLVINTPSTIRIKDIIASDLEFKNELTDPLLLGGPVQKESLWAIHSDDFSCESTSNVSSSISISAIHEVLGALARGEGPEKYLLGCGYAGWAPGQLDREIEEGSWWLTSLDTEYVLDMPYSDRWDAALKKIGIDPLSSFFNTGEF